MIKQATPHLQMISLSLNTFLNIFASDLEFDSLYQVKAKTYDAPLASQCAKIRSLIIDLDCNISSSAIQMLSSVLPLFPSLERLEFLGGEIFSEDNTLTNVVHNL